MDLIYSNFVTESLNSYRKAAVSTVKEIVSYFKDQYFCRTSLICCDKQNFPYLLKTLYLATYRPSFTYYDASSLYPEPRQSDPFTVPPNFHIFQQDLRNLYRQAEEFNKAFCVNGAPGYQQISTNGKKFSEEDMFFTLASNMQEFVSRYDEKPTTPFIRR